MGDLRSRQPGGGQPSVAPSPRSQIDVALAKIAATLWCDHCGCEAIAVETVVRDGQGEKCEACGFPGSVVLDAETDPQWQTSDDPNAVCEDRTCQDETCRMRRAEEMSDAVNDSEVNRGG